MSLQGATVPGEEKTAAKARRDAKKPFRSYKRSRKRIFEQPLRAYSTLFQLEDYCEQLALTIFRVPTCISIMELLPASVFSLAARLDSSDSESLASVPVTETV